ncbi:MAG: hypothetical protein AB7L92_08175, partial [Alphaproteobacteria bacterium]
MASIVLSAVGGVAGSATGLPHAAAIGARLGQFAGGLIDRKLTEKDRSTHRHGSRLAELGVQTSTYGNFIPIIYGSMRIGGNIIWSQPIREIATTTSTTSSAGGGGKGGGGKVTQTSTTYSYDITLAVAICEGPVDEVVRIWADAQQLDLSQFTLRIYNGDETQTPDSLMQSYDGVENTPAYRGLAYVVFEQFPLADYGNRIPNFTFEVLKKTQHAEFNGDLLEDMV